jgi:two-component system, OmpR family, response regulator
MQHNILIVDDDPHIRDVAIFALEKAGMVTCSASNGNEALQVFRNRQPNLLILDINMPEMNGFDVCRELRKISDVPILFLSSRDDEIDRVVGLEIGGDDYVTKPFSPRELTARVQAILKRTQRAATPIQSNRLSHGKLTLDSESHSAKWSETSVILTATEFSIVCGMLKKPERVWMRDDIITLAHGDNIYISDRTVDSHIRHIRDKFLRAGGENVIETVRGIGYKLGPCR